MADDSGQGNVVVDPKNKLREELRRVEFKIAEEQKALVALEDAAKRYPVEAHKDRAGYMAYLNTQITAISEAGVDFGDWARKAGEFYEVTSKNPELISGAAKKMGKTYLKVACSLSFVDEKTSLEQWLTSFIPEDRDSALNKLAEIFSLPEKPPFIPLVYPDLPSLERLEDSQTLFDDYFLIPSFWARVEDVCYREQAMRSITLTQLSSKLESLGWTDAVRTIFPERPYDHDIVVKKDYLEDLKRQKVEIETLLATPAEAPPEKPPEEPPETSAEEQAPSSPIQTMTSAGDDLGQRLVADLTKALLANDPTLTPDIAKARATELVKALMAKRWALINKYAKIFRVRRPDVPEAEILAEATRLVNRELEAQFKNLVQRYVPAAKDVTPEVRTAGASRQAAVREVGRRLENARAEGRTAYGFDDYRRHPELIPQQIGAWLKDYWNRNWSVAGRASVARSAARGAGGVETVANELTGGNWRAKLKSFFSDPLGSAVKLFRIKNRETPGTTGEPQATDRPRPSPKQESVTYRRVLQVAGRVFTRLREPWDEGVAWRANVRSFLFNPGRSIVNLFRLTKGAGKAAEAAKTTTTLIKTGAAVTKAGAAVGEAATEGGAIAAGTAAGGIPGVVITAAVVAKAVLDKVMKSELVQNLLSKLKIAAAAAILWLLLNPGAMVGAIVGTMMGGAVAPILGPLAPVAGFSAGAFLGYTLQGIATSILGPGGGVGAGGMGISGTAPSLASSSSTTIGGGPSVTGGLALRSGLTAAMGNLWGLITGTGFPSVAFWSIPVGISAVGIFSAGTMITIASAVQDQERSAPIGQTREAVFVLTKEALTSALPDYDGSMTAVEYKLKIRAGADQIKIDSARDRLTRSNSPSWSKNVVISAPEQVEANQTAEVIYSVQISGNGFRDSRLLNIAELSVTDMITGEGETQTASAEVTVGTPEVETSQPFGYPAPGLVSSLDLVSGDRTHTSYFYYPGKRIDGGIDIAATGENIPVYATMDGEVVLADWKRSSSPSSDVGGVVYVKNGPYIVEYMHLDESVKNLSGQVHRGQIIGRTYSGKLGAIRSSSGGTGQHVHYQVLFNGANLPFNNPDNIGRCAAGKYLPTLPRYLGTVTATTSQVCD